MESNAISLQEKIQKLIDQYTKDKKKLASLEEENATLKEQSLQLIKQIEEMNQTQSGSSGRIKELEKQLKDLEGKYQELQQTLSGFETIAGNAISKIDSIFPELNE